LGLKMSTVSLIFGGGGRACHAAGRTETTDGGSGLFPSSPHERTCSLPAARTVSWPAASRAAAFAVVRARDRYALVLASIVL
jgi:hypothetical protein